ncbi:MAG: ABC transporter substrate-binding protein, partial [bacterium]|nr:ABC transporter substrate-binding protein [bacterium]
VSVSTATWRAAVQQLGSPTALDGMISTVWLKDPLDTAKYGNDAGVKLFKDVMTKYGNGCDPSGADQYCVAGMAQAYTMVNVLKKAGNNLTRQNLMNIAAKNLNETNNPLTLPSIVIKTTGNDHRPIQQMQLQRWQGTSWVPFGQVINVRSQTS